MTVMKPLTPKYTCEINQIAIAVKPEYNRFSRGGTVFSPQFYIIDYILFFFNFRATYSNQGINFNLNYILTFRIVTLF